MTTTVEVNAVAAHTEEAAAALAQAAAAAEDEATGSHHLLEIIVAMQLSEPMYRVWWMCACRDILGKSSPVFDTIPEALTFGLESWTRHAKATR